MENREAVINVIIPNFNGKALLASCLSSITAQSYSSFRITVVDNGSTDGSADFIRGAYPQVHLIALSENHGFSAAVNQGIAANRDPYIFLLNNDTELDTKCLAHLGDAAKRLPEYDFFAPKMLSYQQRDMLDGAGDGFLRGGAGYRLGTMEKDDPEYSRPGPVFGACGGAVLYRQRLFERIGIFDEDFFAYLEDVDLNLRANRAGLKCYYVPDARVYHIGCATTGSKFNELTIRLSTRNSFFVLLKNYPLALFLRFFPVILVYQLLWLAFVVKKRQFSPYITGLGQVFGRIREMRAKRLTAAPDALTTGELAKRLKKSERDVLHSIMRRRSAAGKGNQLLLLYRFLFL